MINVLVTEKKLGPDFHKLIHKLRKFRNETVHGDVQEVIFPEKNDLKTAIEIVEHLIDEIYVKNNTLQILNNMLGSVKRRRGLTNINSDEAN